MDINIEETGACQKKICVDIPVQEIRSKLNESYRDLNRQVDLPGFRRGKAPRAILEKKYGEHVTKDVHEQLVKSALDEAVKEHSLELVGTPDLGELPALDPASAMKFEVKIEVRPEFELPEYKGIEVKTRKPQVSDKEVEIFLRNICLTKGTFNDLEEGEKSQKGDVIFGSFHCECEGERLAWREKGTLEIGYDLVLGLEIPDAESAFTGLEPGEKITKEFEVTIPADFAVQTHVGKKARVVINVREIKRPDAPELTDELAEELDFDNVAELEEYARENLTADKTNQIEQELDARILKKVVGQVQFEVPPRLAESRLSEFLQREALARFEEGMNEAEAEASVEQRREEISGDIEQQLRQEFLIEAIAKKERLFVTEDEITRYVVGLAMRRGVDPATLAQEMADAGTLTSVRWYLREAKVRTFLRQKANVEYLGQGSDDSSEEPQPVDSDQDAEPAATAGDEAAKE